MQQQGGPAAAEQSQQLPEQHPSLAGGGAGSGRSGDGAERAGGTGVGSHPSPERDCPNFNSGGEGGKEGGREGGRRWAGGEGKGWSGKPSALPGAAPPGLRPPRPPLRARPYGSPHRGAPGPPLTARPGREEKVCRAEGPEPEGRGGGAARHGGGTDPPPAGAAAAAIFQSHGTVPARPAPAALFHASAPPVGGRALLLGVRLSVPRCSRVWWGFLIYFFSPSLF